MKASGLLLKVLNKGIELIDNISKDAISGCENGRVVMSYDDARIEFSDGTVETVSTQDDGIYYEGGKDYWGFQHIRQIADFYRSVEEGKDPFISGREALKIQKLICAIYESAKTGKTVVF